MADHIDNLPSFVQLLQIFVEITDFIWPQSRFYKLYGPFICVLQVFNLWYWSFVATVQTDNRSQSIISFLQCERGVSVNVLAAFDSVSINRHFFCLFPDERIKSCCRVCVIIIITCLWDIYYSYRHLCKERIFLLLPEHVETIFLSLLVDLRHLQYFYHQETKHWFHFLGLFGDHCGISEGENRNRKWRQTSSVGLKHTDTEGNKLQSEPSCCLSTNS